MLNRAVTRADVEDFKRFSLIHEGIVFLRKADIPFEQYVEWLLDTLKTFGVTGLPDGDEWTHDFFTTVGTLVLEGDEGEPASDLETDAHECGHALDFKAHPDRAVWLYLTSDEARAAYEAAQYLTGAYVRFRLTGQRTELAWIRTALENAYAMSARAVDLAMDLITQGLSAVYAGAALTPGMQHFERWAKARFGADLSAPPDPNTPSAPSAR